MTLRDMYEYALIELNKIEAPSLLLEDYNYFMNKAVQQYINKVYNRYDINQQSSDDLRVLKATVQLNLKKVINGKTADKDRFVYEATLPDDYMHILNCIVDFRVNKNYKCYRAGDHVDFAAKRLTADMAAGILHNVYMRPDYKRPYFYINNVNLLQDTVGEFTKVAKNKTSYSEYIPTYGDLQAYDAADISAKYGEAGDPGAMPEQGESESAADYSTRLRAWAEQNYLYMHQDPSNSLGDSVKPKDKRDANASEVRIEIRFGADDTIFQPSYIYIDYIKAPMFIRLTYDDITSTEDRTRLLEFPDYVCFEIVNEFVKLVMENASDPRLQTHYAINQTIADPTAATQSSQK